MAQAYVPRELEVMFLSVFPTSFPGLFPQKMGGAAPPIFWGKSPGDEVGVFLYLVARLSTCVGTPFIFLYLFITALSFQLLILLGLLTDRRWMSDFHILLYSPATEIPSLSYNRSLKKVTLSGGATPYKPLTGVPPGQWSRSKSIFSPWPHFCSKCRVIFIVWVHTNYYRDTIYVWSGLLARQTTSTLLGCFHSFKCNSYIRQTALYIVNDYD